MYQFFSMCLFLFITLYMFRTYSAHHQERRIVPVQPLITVILYWWPRCVQVGRRGILLVRLFTGFSDLLYNNFFKVCSLSRREREKHVGGWYFSILSTDEIIRTQHTPHCVPEHNLRNLICKFALDSGRTKCGT